MSAASGIKLNSAFESDSRVPAAGSRSMGGVARLACCATKGHKFSPSLELRVALTRATAASLTSVRASRAARRHHNRRRSSRAVWGPKLSRTSSLGPRAFELEAPHASGQQAASKRLSRCNMKSSARNHQSRSFGCVHNGARRRLGRMRGREHISNCVLGGWRDCERLRASFTSPHIAC